MQLWVRIQPDLSMPARAMCRDSAVGHFDTSIYMTRLSWHFYLREAFQVSVQGRAQIRKDRLD